MTATPETGIAQAGVGFMFAEPVGNSCRLTYSYCPARARARAIQLALSVLALRRSALPTAYSQWWIYSCWCPKRWLYLEHSPSPRELVGSSRARAASLNQRTSLLARSRRR